MSKFRVCPACDGEGKDFSTSVALTEADIDEWAGQDFEDRMAFVSSVASITQPCALCHGKRVVTHQDARNWEEDVELRWERQRESMMLGEW